MMLKKTIAAAVAVLSVVNCNNFSADQVSLTRVDDSKDSPTKPNIDTSAF